MTAARIVLSAHPVGASLEGGGRRMWPLYIPACVSHTMALSLLLAFVCEDCISFIFL